MRWVLPGGASLSGDATRAACRPGDAVVERLAAQPAGVPVPPTPPGRVDVEPHAAPAVAATEPPRPKTAERLATVKLFLEVVAVLVGLIGAVLAMFGLSRK